MDIYSWILALSIASGQLIRLPIDSQGITLLDITIILLSLWRILKIKFRLGKPTIQIRAALIFIFIAIFSLILTPLHLQPGEYLISFSYIFRFSLYVLFAWLFFKNNMTRALLLSGISFAILGLLQFIFFPNLDFLRFNGWDPHYFRTVSTFLDPNFTGAFLVLTMLMLMSLRGSRLWRETKQSLLMFIIIYIALLTTFSRSSYLMFLVSGLTLSFLKKSKTIFIATVMLFIVLLLGFQAYTNLVSKPRNIDRTQSASFRINTWQQGLNLFWKSPVLGIGFNAYRYGIKQYNLGDQQFINSHGSSSNDSSLLFVLSTTGIIGLLTFIYFLWTLMLPRNPILITGLTGLLIHSLFANSLFYPPILAWILINSTVPKK